MVKQEVKNNINIHNQSGVYCNKPFGIGKNIDHEIHQQVRI